MGRARLIIIFFFLSSSQEGEGGSAALPPLNQHLPRASGGVCSARGTAGPVDAGVWGSSGMAHVRGRGLGPPANPSPLTADQPFPLPA